MNTNKLKPFAQTARQILMEGVTRRVLYLGFDAKGKVVEEPMSVAGGVILRGEVIDDPTLLGKWNALRSAIQRNGIENVVEEAAYTWFNRMMAIRIMAKNNYDLPQLEYDAEGSHTPLILTRARRGIMGFLSQREQARVTPLLGDYSQEQKTFAILLTGYCHHHRLLNRIFGRLNDYTELLLPDNILSETGFLHLLNTSDAISDEDYRKVELIGWLYQFYISEKKDQVFAGFKKNKKAEAADIPAATQIFTPNWIVKYMVQNTVGRLWLDNHPESPLKEKMKYLVESPQQPSPAGKEEKLELKSTNHIEMKLLDPACGSGHILVEGFYHLYDMYEEEYYMPAEAVDKILEHNLYGLDIDLRASQLAQFAVMLAAASKYPDILKSDVTPHIYTMPEPDRFTPQEIREFLGSEGVQHEKVLTRAIDLMQQAKNLGSVMQFNVTDAERRFFRQRLNTLQTEARTSLMAQSLYNKLVPFLQVMQVMTDRYEAVVANPPYMGQKNMNGALKEYVNNHYSLSKSDLFAVFMDVCLNGLNKLGKMGMINQHSWMFLSSFEGFRNHLLKKYWFENMLHLGPRTFEELSGEVVQSTVFVFSYQSSNAKVFSGNYHRLVDYKSVGEKELNFINQTDLHENIPQSNFSKIPGSPIAYWVSEKITNCFIKSKSFLNYGKGVKGLDTGDDNYFLKQWWEPKFNLTKWIPYNKGGSFRKWYGNNLFIINWENNGSEIKNFKGSCVRNIQYYFKEGLEWSRVSSLNFGVRLIKDSIFGGASQAAFVNKPNFTLVLLALLNSKFSLEILKILNPTLIYQAGDINRIPTIIPEKILSIINRITNSNIEISKSDWDNHETSWDFKTHPLIRIEQKSLQSVFQSWKNIVTRDFHQLHANETELNQIFIDAYGLNDELNPIVPLQEITILQEELDFTALAEVEKELRKRRQWKLEEGKWNLYVDNVLQPILEEGELPKATVQPPLPIKKNVVMQQLISYAVGCMMGRYSLDAPGLILANQGDTLEDYFRIVKEKQEKGEKVERMPESIMGKFVPDEDAIIPLMGSNCGFPDDAVHRMRHFIEVVWGSDSLTQNINFLHSCLDMDLEKYLVTQGNFWKDHLSRYKKKPIYWLFSSKKGAFQVLVYMHRMNRFTVQKIRDNYLLRHLQWLSNQVAQLQSRASQFNRNEAKRLDYFRAAFAECEEYDLHLKNIADQQIEFDLDDGVSVNYEKFRPVVAEIK